MTNKVGMISLGCPKNQVDGEVMLEKLNKSGFEIAQSIEDSDVMIINTCGFIEDAKREAIETILEVAEYKKAGIISTDTYYRINFGNFFNDFILISFGKAPCNNNSTDNPCLFIFGY